MRVIWSKEAPNLDEIERAYSKSEIREMIDDWRQKDYNTLTPYISEHFQFIMGIKEWYENL